MKPLVALLVGCLTIAGASAQSILDIRLNEVLANGNLVRNLGGRGMDLIELYNPTDADIPLRGAKLTDGSFRQFPYTPPKFTFPTDAVIPAHGFFVVALDPDNTNNNFGLRATGDEIVFTDSNEVEITSVRFGFQVFNMSIGRSPDGDGEWTLTEPSFGNTNIAVELGNWEPGAVRINEWRSQGNDFVELFNTRPLPLPLGSLRFADAGIAIDPNPFFWPAIAPLSFIGTGKTNGFVLFRADANGDDKLPFGLSGGNGDALYLATPTGIMLDQVIVRPLSDNDINEGRLPDGAETITFFENRDTPGRPNFGKITTIVINELLAHTDPPLEDAIELRNTNDFDVDISGWYMGDSNDSLRRYQFPSNTIVPANGFYVLYEYQFRYASSPADFTFNSSKGGTVYISQPDPEGSGTLLAGLEQPFGPSQNGVSFGRVVTSDGDEDFVALACRSFGVDNPKSNPQFRTGTGAPNCEPHWGPIVINEIMFHPPDLGLADNTNEEYIEIRNTLPSPFRLVDSYGSPWHLRGGVTYDFTSADTIPAGGYLLLVKFNPAADIALKQAFLQRYNLPETVLLRGPYTGRLGNGDDTLELYKPDPPEPGFIPYVLVDRVHYEDKPESGWPVGSNGTGLSLQRRNLPAYGDEPTSWRDFTPTPAAANATAVMISSHPASQSVLYSNDAVFSVTASGDELSYVWLYKNKPLRTNAQIATVTEPTLVIHNLNRKNAGLYSVVVSNITGKVTSSNALLTAIQPVGFKSHPRSRSAVAGKTATFSATAIGTKPVFYQWYHKGIAIEGATNKVLKFTAQPGMEGSYTSHAWNVLSEADSDAAELTITQ